MREHKNHLQYHMKHGKYCLVRTKAGFLDSINGVAELWKLHAEVTDCGTSN